MKKIDYILLLLFIFAGICIFQVHANTPPTTLLYHKVLNKTVPVPELVEDTGVAANYTPEGLKITGNEGTIRLDKYYSLGERMIRYHVKFSDDAIALFKSNTDDFKLSVDIAKKSISVATSPESWKMIDFLDADHEYLIEIYHSYLKNSQSP